MVVIKSQRAMSLLASSEVFIQEKTPGMRRFPGDQLVLWGEVNWDQGRVKNLSFFGELEPWQKVILMAVSLLMSGKDLSKIDQLSLRECEAFLRDRNSQMAIENLPETAEADFKKLFTWIRLWPLPKSGASYSFPLENGSFRQLKLADKVRELKAFLNSRDVIELYQGLPAPELVDVDQLSVFIEAPYQTDKDKVIFEELHVLGVLAFQEEELNFIPEA